MKLQKQHMMAISVVAVLVAVIIIGILVMRKPKTGSSQQSSVLPTQTVLPTVNPSVSVSLSPQNGGKQVTLSINGIPGGTKTIEYEISYNASNRESPGIYSILNTDPNEKTWSKTFDVGTCSSGVCIYDKVVGGMKVQLKFTGSYGEQIFEKEFPFAQL